MAKTMSFAVIALLFLGAASAVLPYAGVAQGTSGTVLYVALTPSGSGVPGGSCSAPGFNTVSGAVAYAENNVINGPESRVEVCPGTYAGQVVITKSLDIVGTSARNPPVIQAPSTPLAPDPLCVTYASSPGCSPAITDIVDISGPKVSVGMTDVVVSGPGPGGCWSIEFGIFVYGGASLTLKDSQITKIEDTPFSGCQNGVALQAGWSTALGAPVEEVGSATLVNVNINNYQKNGITVDGAGSMLTMSGSTVTGAGPQATNGQNGVQISEGANANIRGSTISGDIWTATAQQNPGYPSGPNIETELQSPCVLFYYGGDSTVLRGNTFTACDAGIDAFATNSGPGMSISKNRFVDPTWYGAILQDSNMTLTGNRFVGGFYGVAVVADAYGSGTTTTGTLVGNIFHGQTDGPVLTMALPGYMATVKY